MSALGFVLLAGCVVTLTGCVVLKVVTWRDRMSEADATATECAPPPKKDDPWHRYIAHANDLPLLTDEELQRFALTGEHSVITSGELGSTWTSPLNTQFVIRLRRTLLAKAANEAVAHE